LSIINLKYKKIYAKIKTKILYRPEERVVGEFMIVDNRYTFVAEKAWGDRFNIIPSVTCKSVPAAISAHPDMTLFQLEEKVFICAPDCFEEYKKRVFCSGTTLICGEKQLGSTYPEDVAYNVLKINNLALGKILAADPVVLNHLTDKKIELINVNQGYSKCSVCTFSGCAITADEGIFSALKNRGTEVLKIPYGEIKLTGYDYGFIGGASGEYKGEIFFFGDLDSVSYGQKIREFICSKGKTINEIKNYPLTDVGTITFC